MEEKYDFFKTLIASPNATPADFKAAGFTVDNYYIKDFSAYKNDDSIRNQFKNNNGDFDENLLKDAYNNSIILYNIIANNSYDDLIKRLISYGKYDYLAPQELRRKGPDFLEIKMANPYRQVYGLTTIGQVEEPTMSMDEIAQTNKVLSNPKTAGTNLENAIWEETPNEHFWKYFWDTLVLALYDTDGEHKDPITGEIVLHKKGDLRTNENGEFFYEKLDGRSIYGRLVLNKGNILTVDGSKWNRYDIFDSDNLNLKNPIKTLLMNTALVGSMFLGGGVGTWITGITLATNLVGLAGVLGKMVDSSDNPTLSALEGWSASWDRRRAKTEYAQLHPWCWESFIDMIGDFVEIPRTLRFIFEKVPYIVKGGDFISVKGQEAKLQELMKSLSNLNQMKVALLLRKSEDLVNTRRLTLELSNIEILRAMAEHLLSSITKSAQTIGEIFSKGYMALNIASNTYGEAKAAGASDIDATMLTLGYTAGLYALLNAGVSKWIFPELKAGGYQARAIAKALIDNDEELKIAMNKLTPRMAKLNYVKKIFNIGKGIANGAYADGSKTLSATVASGVGMGVEGMGFEFLSDLSKGCYDVVKWLQGEDHRMETFGYNFDTDEWNIRETLSQYGETFLSALIGGSIANAFETYKGMGKIGNIDKKTAASLLVYMIRNGQISDFIRSLNRMDLGNKNLSFRTEEVNGEYVFKPGTKNDNQDLSIKNRILNQILLWDNMLNAEGAKIPDDSFLDILTLKDLRYINLLKSIIRDSYLDEYNSSARDLLLNLSEYNDLLNSVADINNDKVVSDRDARRAGKTIEERLARLDPVARQQADGLETNIKELRKKVKDFQDGKKSYDYIKDSMFDMNEFIKGSITVTSFPLYVQYAYGKTYDKLSDSEKNEALEKYEKWKELDYKERLRVLSDNFYDMLVNLKDTLKEHGDTYHKTEQSILLARNFIERVSEFYLVPILRGIPTDSEFHVLRDLLDALMESFGTPEEALEYAKGKLLVELARHDKELSDTLKKEINLRFLDEESKILNRIIKSNFIDVFQDLKYIPTESKNLLLLLLNTLKNEFLPKYNKILLKVMDSFGTDEKAIKDFNTANILMNSLIENINTITELDESPLWKNINTFIAAINRDNPEETITIDNIFKTALKLYNLTLSDITRFKLSDTQLEQLQSALDILTAYKAAIEASRKDNAGVGNVFGYATTLNEVARKMDILGKERLELTEIDSDIANKLINDINVNANKIEYLLLLHLINEGQKLSTLDRVAVKTKEIIYDKIRRAINTPDNPLATWNGFKEFLATINSLTLLLELCKSKTTFLDQNNKRVFELERIKYEDAIFDFFDKNLDKLKDPKKLAQFINPKIFNLYEKPDDLLDDNVKSLSDNSIIWYFCSRAALKSSTFYSRLGRIINLDSDSPIAPVFMLELAVYMNYASIINHEMFDNFYNAYRYALREDFKKRNKEEKIKIYTDLGQSKEAVEELSDPKFDKYCFNFLPVPKYANIVLVEGMPGTGKSAGVLPQTIALLKMFNPEVLKNIIVLYGDNIESARELAEKLGLEGATVYGIDEFAEKYIIDYEKFSSDSIDENSFANDDYGVVPSVEVKTPENNSPQLIIVDEILRLNTVDVTAIQKFAEELGVSVIGCGDFELSGVEKSVDLSIEGTPKKLLLKIQNESFEFIRVPKLGLSMRTDNVLKTRNINAIRKLIRGAEKAILTYYSDESGLYGDRVITYTLEELEVMRKALWYTTLIDTVDLMVKTLPEGEKIGFIYSDPKSPFIQLLQAAYQKGDDCPIDFKSKSAAAGKEATYYIIDATIQEGDTNNIILKKDINTGISRATKGSLLLLPAEVLNIDEQASPSKIDEPKNKSSIIKYAADLKKLLLELFPNTEEVKEISSKKPKTTDETQEEKPEDKEKPEEKPVPYSSDFANGTDESGLNSDLKTHTYIEDLIVKEAQPKSKSLTVDEKGNIRIIASTFNNFYHGLVIKNGKIVLNPELFKERVDGGNGLLKLMKSDKAFENRLTVDQIENYLIAFQDILLNVKDKDTMIKRISNIISTYMNSDFKGEEFFVNFGYKQIAHSSIGGSYDSGKYTEFSRDRDEVTKFNNSESSIPNDRMIVAVIGTKNKGIVLEVPLLTLSSPLSIMQCSDQFKGVYTVFNSEYLDSLSKGNDERHAVVDGVNAILKNKDLIDNPKFTQLINLFKIFNRSKADFTYIIDNNLAYGTLSKNNYEKWKKSKLPDTENWLLLLRDVSNEINKALDRSTWTPAKDLDLIGSRIVKLRGEVLVLNEYKVDARKSWMTINDLKKRKGLYVSKRIYTVSKNFSDKDGNIIAKAGNSFILVSCTSELLDDERMWNNFINNRNGKLGVDRLVELIYVSPPKATIKEYFLNLARVYAQNSNERALNAPKKIGLLFTAYRILQSLLNGYNPANEGSKLDPNAITDERKILATKFGDDYANDIINKIETLTKLEIDNEDGTQLVADLLMLTTNYTGLQGVEFETSLSNMFNYTLFHLAENKKSIIGSSSYSDRYIPDQQVFADIEKCFPEGVYYNLVKEKNPTSFDTNVIPIDTNKDYEVEDGKSVLVFGKFDTYAFRGDLSRVILNCLNSGIDVEVTSKTGKTSQIFSSPDAMHYSNSIHAWLREVYPREPKKTTEAPKENQHYTPLAVHSGKLIKDLDKTPYYRTWEENGLIRYEFYPEENMEKAINNHDVLVDRFCEVIDKDKVDWNEAVNVINVENGILDSNGDIIKKAIVKLENAKGESIEQESHESINLFEAIPVGEISFDILNNNRIKDLFPKGIDTIEILDLDGNKINLEDLEINNTTQTYNFKIIINGVKFDVEYDPNDEERNELLELVNEDDTIKEFCGTIELNII